MDALMTCEVQVVADGQFRFAKALGFANVCGAASAIFTAEVEVSVKDGKFVTRPSLVSQVSQFAASRIWSVRFIAANTAGMNPIGIAFPPSAPPWAVVSPA